MVTKNEEFKFRMIEEFRAGKQSRKRTAELLNLSERQISRLRRKIDDAGLLGIKHGNFGKVPANKIDTALKARTISLVKDHFYDFNMTHCKEMLQKEYGIEVSYSVFRTWCHDARLVKIKRRRSKKLRKYRDRMANEGLLLQMDGSFHKWNGKEEWCLIGAIDDATSRIAHAEFFKGETTWNCMKVLRGIIKNFGIPVAIYTDKAGWARSSKRIDFGHFVRACDELGIRVILANSPEAKGRIERCWKTFQDRLIPELRYYGIKSREKANDYLKNEFLKNYWEKRNTVLPDQSETRYKSLPPGKNLNEILVYKLSRKVRKDQTFLYKQKLYRLINLPFIGSIKLRELVIHIEETGRWRPFFADQELECEEIKAPIKRRGYLGLHRRSA